MKTGEQPDLSDAPNHYAVTERLSFAIYAADPQILFKRQLSRRHQFDCPNILLRVYIV